MAIQRIKAIETDFFQTLESQANNFLATTPGLVVEKIICDDFIPLASANAANNFTCLFHITGVALQPTRIKLLMRDSSLDLEQAITAALALLGMDNLVSELQRWDAILDNGNKYYCCCLIYAPSVYPSGTALCKIFEKDNIGDLERAVNTFLAGPIIIAPGAVYRQEMILANGNKVYTCTIIYAPELT